MEALLNPALIKDRTIKLA
ncbi:hypothetical protein F383_29980 [Gossypium arboreum]|uniref:Uncharacterized protein n=1 Tax=Gossypium arboreum TaxID=29729 RepID=A0A0B0MWA6_GOSAR|nr:hypothetical protein F383_29980 [Gossypium arboreum]